MSVAKVSAAKSVFMIRLHVTDHRPAILCISAAADQPLTKDGLTIVYNGELYNYRALRAELSTYGVQFRTQSDTEVLVHLYEQHGPAFAERKPVEVQNPRVFRLGVRLAF